MMRKRTTLRQVAATLIFALTLGLVTVNNNAPVAQAAVTTSGIVYDGEGSVTQNLTTGTSATVSLADCVPSIVVGGTTFDYPYSTRHVGTVVIADDDLLHMFWLTGHYIVYDLRSNGMFLIAGASSYDESAMKAKYYKASSTKDSGCVLGLTGKAVHSCIISKKYFYNADYQMIQLMTRAEFEELRYGTTTEPTTAPTTAPTVAPTTAPTTAPTVTPTTAPTTVPTLSPTTVPSGTPDVTITTDFQAYIEWMREWQAQMTWQAYAQLNGIVNWQEVETSYERSETNYTYDDDGKLVKEVTEKYGVSNEKGDATVKAEVAASGSAQASGTETGAAKVTGNATTNIYYNTGTATKSSTTSSTKKDKKVYWSTTRQGHRVKLWKTTVWTTASGKIKSCKKLKSYAIFNEKKHWVRFNGIKIKHVKKCQYIKKSNRLGIILDNGKVWSYPIGKGHAKRKLIARKAITFKCVSSKYYKGLVTSVVFKNGKLKKVVGK